MFRDEQWEQQEHMGWNDLIGMRLDQYEILDELGRGGSSRVYHAYDTEGERDVAIKVIPNDADDRALFTSRFAREVAAVQKLHHPNIVKVFGAGENDEFVYLVMQCVTGGTLRRQLSGPLPAPVAVAYMVQIAYALHHAHERGIIHRDVKPSNMLLEYPGSNHLLLTDFGIAKIQGARGLTKSGTTIGTPEYMSPEQAEGRDIDERSDIYALGCVLYETLAGRPPFLGSTPVSVLFQHVHSRPAYIRGFNPGVPGELVQILEIALAKRPDERFGTAESFARALRPFAGEMPEVTSPATGDGANRDLALQWINTIASTAPPQTNSRERYRGSRHHPEPGRLCTRWDAGRGNSALASDQRAQDDAAISPPSSHDATELRAQVRATRSHAQDDATSAPRAPYAAAGALAQNHAAVRASSPRISADRAKPDAGDARI